MLKMFEFDGSCFIEMLQKLSGGSDGQQDLQLKQFLQEMSSDMMTVFEIIIGLTRGEDFLKHHCSCAALLITGVIRNSDISATTIKDQIN